MAAPIAKLLPPSPPNSRRFIEMTTGEQRELEFLSTDDGGLIVEMSHLVEERSGATHLDSIEVMLEADEVKRLRQFLLLQYLGADEGDSS